MSKTDETTSSPINVSSVLPGSKVKTETSLLPRFNLLLVGDKKRPKLVKKRASLKHRCIFGVQHVNIPGSDSTASKNGESTSLCF